MPNCLGVHIEKNLIKYAKVSKEKEKINIDSYGVKFYTNLSQAIKQIVEETNSYKVPISTNISEETYQYFAMSNLLSKKDLKKAVDLEFEAYCADKDYDKDAYETRCNIVSDIHNNDKFKIINIAEDKIELERIEHNFEGYRVKTIVPMSMAIINAIDFPRKENSLVVNIENNTTITTILNGQIYNIDKIEQGSGEILEKLNLRENSYAEAYEICQNTTIYTMDSVDFSEEQSMGLEYIMPTLYNIVGNVQKVINESIEPIHKVYITGTLSCVNNIDLYFQEYLGNVKCEILKPYFIQDMVKRVNVKEYIEVNSAVALALQGLGQGIKEINFKKEKVSDSILNIEIGRGGLTSKNGSKIDFSDFGGQFTKGEVRILRTIVALILFIVIFTGFSVILSNQIDKKQEDVEILKEKINVQISKVEEDTKDLNKITTDYTTLITGLQKVNDKVSEIKASKNLIPNLLNQIMSVVDETVQITSIENTTDKHIVIKAQSTKYPGLGYFKTRLKTQKILKDVTSGPSVKQDGVVTVTIEGDLP